MPYSDRAWTFALLAQADTKFCFCHYMVGTLNRGSRHAGLGVDQAQAMGFDAFALNVGLPTAEWALNTTDQLFTHAAYKSRGSSSSVAPPAGSAPAGAMWYRSISKDAVCAKDLSEDRLDDKPRRTQWNYAIALPATASGLSIRLSGDRNELQTIIATAGLQLWVFSVPNSVNPTEISLVMMPLSVYDDSGMVIRWDPVIVACERGVLEGLKSC